MQWLMRIVCIGYFVFLTLLLLSHDPTRVIGMQGGLPWILQVMLPIAHIISFMVLAILALMTLACAGWSIVLYYGMTEFIQGYVPFPERHN